jgi:hypothetical protein
MDTIPLVCCFIGVGAVLTGFLRVAHSLFEGEPIDLTKVARLKKVREPYMVLMLPTILVGSVSSVFLPVEEGRGILGVFVLMFLFYYYFALRDIRKVVRSP